MFGRRRVPGRELPRARRAVTVGLLRTRAWGVGFEDEQRAVAALFGFGFDFMYPLTVSLAFPFAFAGPRSDLMMICLVSEEASYVLPDQHKKALAHLFKNEENKNLTSTSATTKNPYTRRRTLPTQKNPNETLTYFSKQQS
jgi:hypothetical protein